LLNLDRSQQWLKSLLQNLNGVISLRNSFEAKSAGGIRLDRRKRFRAALEGNRCVGHRSAAGIDNRPCHWRRAGLALSQGAKQRNKTEKQEAASPHSSPSLLVDDHLVEIRPPAGRG